MVDSKRTVSADAGFAVLAIRSPVLSRVNNMRTKIRVEPNLSQQLSWEKWRETVLGTLVTNGIGALVLLLTDTLTSHGVH